MIRKNTKSRKRIKTNKKKTINKKKKIGGLFYPISSIEKVKIGVYGGSFDPPTNMHLQIAQTLITSKIVDIVLLVPSGTRSDKPNLTDPMHRWKMCELAIQSQCKGLPIYVSPHEIFCEKEFFTYDSLNFIQSKYPKDEIYYVVGSDYAKPRFTPEGKLNYECLINWESQMSKNLKEKLPDLYCRDNSAFIETGDDLVRDFHIILAVRPGEGNPTKFIKDVRDIQKQNDPDSRKTIRVLDCSLWQDCFEPINSNMSSSEVRFRAYLAYWDEYKQKKKEYIPTVLDNWIIPTLDTITGMVSPTVHSYICQHCLYSCLDFERRKVDKKVKSKQKQDQFILDELTTGYQNKFINYESLSSALLKIISSDTREDGSVEVERENIRYKIIPFADWNRKDKDTIIFNPPPSFDHYSKLPATNLTPNSSFLTQNKEYPSNQYMTKLSEMADEISKLGFKSMAELKAISYLYQHDYCLANAKDKERINIQSVIEQREKIEKLVRNVYTLKLPKLEEDTGITTEILEESNVALSATAPVAPEAKVAGEQI